MGEQSSSSAKAASRLARAVETIHDLGMSVDAGTSWYDLTFSEMKRFMVDDGLSPVHAKTLWRALYREAPGRLHGRNEFPPPLKKWVEKKGREQGWAIHSPKIIVETPSSDGLTRKFLLGLNDDEKVETVLMRYRGRLTACLSTQVGCAMGCVFCATGQMGFTRHLRPSEIVAQVLVGRGEVPASSRGGLRNLVLMGMGEPLHNYAAVMTALEIITDTGGLNIGPSRITISTVGIVPGIRRLADEQKPYNLAVSLHGADEVDRSALVPISRRWSLADLMEACSYYGKVTGRRIFFEWTLIAGVNDSPAHAQKLTSLLRGIDGHINLIPLNLTSGYQGAPTDHSMADRFQALVLQGGFPCTVRQRRGLDVAAGCGQLRQAN